MRFRTVVRDTRDTAFVIFSVVVGMAVGARNLWLASIGLSEYAERWLAGRNDEKATAAQDVSIMRNHVLPAWGGYHWTRLSTLPSRHG